MNRRENTNILNRDPVLSLNSVPGRGQMAELVQSKDWSLTSLGGIEQWPQSLKTTISLCLAAQVPIAVIWGPEKVQLYNDAYSPICGDKHPFSLGQNYQECWCSAWPVVGELLEDAFRGKSRSLENQRMFLDRYGYLEETFFTFSFSPILDECGRVGGVFHPVTEMTRQTLAERRRNILGSLSNGQVEAATVREAYRMIADQLSGSGPDLPFVLVYSLSADGKEIRLEGSTGVVPGSQLAPWKADPAASRPTGWPFAEAASCAGGLKIDDLPARFGNFSAGPYPEPPHTAILTALCLPGTRQPVGFLVTGVSSRRALDEQYQTFYRQLSEAVTQVIVSAWNGEEDRKKAVATAISAYARLPFLPAGTGEKAVPGITPYGTTESETEEDLRKFKIMSDHAFDAFILMREDGTFAYLNDQALERWGYTAEEALHLKVWNIDTAYQPQRFSEAFALAQQQVLPPFETAHRRKDGTVFPVEVSMRGVVLSGGKYMFAIARDVTERKNTEKSLRAAKDLLEITLLNVPADIFLYDKAGNMIFANERGAHFMGFLSAKELLAETDPATIRKRGAEFFETFDEEGKPPAPESSPFMRACSTGRGAEAIYRVYSKLENKIRWRLNAATPLRNESGEVNMVLVSTIDITTQKETEILVRHSEEKFRTLTETLPQLVWMTDQSGQYEYASSQWEEYTGLNPLAGGAWQQIVHPADMPAMMQTWSACLESGSVYNSEARIRNREGLYRWHAVHGAPIRNEAGKITKWIGAFTDIHDQKTINEKLEMLVSQRTAELARSNQDLQQFAHVASHDLKEPVRKIKTFAGRLLDDKETALSAKGAVFLQKINAATDRMFGMIEGVLKYSTINSAEHSIEDVDLNSTLHNIQHDLELVIQQKEAAVHCEYLPAIEGSDVLLYQLFYNLLNNSLKFIRPDTKPEITVSASLKEAADKQVEIVVCDNGIGFERLYAERIFETFSRLHSKDRYEGTGLGLSLCKKIVERHGGAIRGEGEPGKGARFTITLPVKQKKSTL